MPESQNTKQYDLEERTARFAEACRDFAKKLPKNTHTHNFEYAKQLIRSSGSQASNYIEANEALSKKDFVHRVRISRKEAKESNLWLRLCDIADDEELEEKRKELAREGVELRSIFTSILNKSS